MIYFVDIDETICHSEPPNYLRSTPIKENIEKINRLYEEKNTIIYWTSRGVTTGENWENLTKHQLKEWGAKYHELRMDKPFFDKFIDDKALRIEEL